MRPARGLVRLVAPLAIALVVVVFGVAAGARRRARRRIQARTGGPSAGSDAGGAKKKARKPTQARRAPPSPRPRRTPRSPAASRRRISRDRSWRTPSRANRGTINEDVTLTPFPSHAGAAKKALAQNRRDQLDDAERAARAPEQAERWQTVLFHLRDLDARSDSEGCFWRLVSYYRLGQIERARSLRPSLRARAQGRLRSSRPRTSRRRACRRPGRSPTRTRRPSGISPPTPATDPPRSTAKPSLTRQRGQAGQTRFDEAANGVEELLQRDRLAQEGGGAGRTLARDGAQHHHRDRRELRIALHRCQNLRAVDERHHHVEHDQMGKILDRRGGEKFQRLLSMAGRNDVVALGLQEILQDVPDFEIVLDEQNRLLRHHPST